MLTIKILHYDLSNLLSITTLFLQLHSFPKLLILAAKEFLVSSWLSHVLFLFILAWHEWHNTFPDFWPGFCHFSFTAHDTASWCMPLNQSQECLQMSIPYNLSKHSKLFWHGRSLGWTLGNQGSTMDKSDQHTEKVREEKNPAKKVVQNM